MSVSPVSVPVQVLPGVNVAVDGRFLPVGAVPLRSVYASIQVHNGVILPTRPVATWGLWVRHRCAPHGYLCYFLSVCIRTRCNVLPCVCRPVFVSSCVPYTDYHGTHDLSFTHLLSNHHCSPNSPPRLHVSPFSSPLLGSSP